VRALGRATLSIPVGQFTAVMGSSGSGKSTLMHALAGLDSIDGGQIRIGDTEMTRWMVRGEAVVVAALATVLGLGLGIGFAAATVAALGAITPISVVLPAGRLLLVVGVALAAGLLARLLPARRAARLDVLNAISAP
jgi:ABC-type cobalamin/Fe3+-siderophores transport system ATPase subunit